MATERRQVRDHLGPTIPLLEYIMQQEGRSMETAAEIIDQMQDAMLLHGLTVEATLFNRGIPLYYARQFLQWGDFARVLEDNEPAFKPRKFIEYPKWFEIVTIWVGGLLIVILVAALYGIVEGWKLKEELRHKCYYTPQSSECVEFINKYSQ